MPPGGASASERARTYRRNLNRRKRRDKRAGRNTNDRINDGSQLDERPASIASGGGGGGGSGGGVGAGGGGGSGGGSGGGGTTVAGPLEDVPQVRPRSNAWNDVEINRFGDLYRDPTLARAAWMESQGLDSQRAGGMTRILDDLAQYAPQLWQLTQLGNVSGEEDITFAQYLDFVDQYLRDYTKTPGEGGGLYSPSIIGDTLFGNLEGSTLDLLLNNPNADPATQVNQVLGLVTGGLATSVPGDIANAILAALDEEGSLFAATSRLGGGTFLDRLKNGEMGDYLRRIG